MYIVTEPEQVKQPNYLHEYTFPELLECSKPVIDMHGTLWIGPNRKGVYAPNPNDLFKAWQKDVQFAGRRAGFVQPHVESYFQATKFFTKAPRKQEAEEIAAQMVKDFPNLKATAESVISAATPRFTWSPSKIMQFDTCPYQFAAQYYYKTLLYQETEATRWGTRVHKAAEDYLLGNGVTDEEAFKPVEKWVKLLGKVPGEKFIEHKLGVDSKMAECDFDKAEGRMILDFGVRVKPDEMLLVDWKTGRVKDSDTQLKIYAVVMALRNPEIQKITYKYVWVKDDITTGGELKRAELMPVLKELVAKINKMKSAWENENFPKNKNGLCRQWCGVTECPNCGR